MRLLRAHAGFTMIELIVVAVMIGILSAVAYPMISSSSFDEAGFRDQVRAGLSFARKSAIAQRRYVEVSLTGSVLAFRIANAVPENPTGRVVTGASGRPLLLPGSESSELAPRGAIALTGPDKLVFAPSGKAEAGSFVYTLKGAATLVLTVDEASGYVY